MGYSTDFFGQFELSKKLTKAQAEYLKMFSDTRRMKRDPEKVKALAGENRNTRCFALLKSLKLDLGVDAENYCGADGSGAFACCGQAHDESILDYNCSPSTQPGLWCKWAPTEDNKGIEWNGCEKFYDYVEWLQYLIDHFLTPWGIKVNGSVEWQGEEREDMGIIEVTDSVVTTRQGYIAYQ